VPITPSSKPSRSSGASRATLSTIDLGSPYRYTGRRGAQAWDDDMTSSEAIAYHRTDARAPVDALDSI
jgi:hypothetical protein